MKVYVIMKERYLATETNKHGDLLNYSIHKVVGTKEEALKVLVDLKDVANELGYQGLINNEDKDILTVHSGVKESKYVLWYKIVEQEVK